MEEILLGHYSCTKTKKKKKVLGCWLVSGSEDGVSLGSRQPGVSLVLPVVRSSSCISVRLPRGRNPSEHIILLQLTFVGSSILLTEKQSVRRREGQG